MLELKYIAPIVQLSLTEDIGSGDISANLLPAELMATATIISREAAIICGIAWVNEVFHQINSKITLQWQVADGEKIRPNQTLVIIEGSARSILSGERSALNWLQTLSATATKTALYVSEITGTKAQLLDTRKTIPGMRYAQKYAVKCGGGVNHRMGLYDAYLIKENHIISAGSITAAIAQARKQNPQAKVEIEVENLNELKHALAASADLILLDNFSLQEMKEAVIITQARVPLEVSGNVTLSNIKEIAQTGVDRISVGALTKHIQAIDLSLRFIQ